MHEPAVVGVQRLGLERPAAVAHGVGEVLDRLQERVVAHVAMVFDIDDHARHLRVRGLEQAIQEKLDVVERLATAADEEWRLVRVNLENEIAVAVLLLDVERKAEVTQDRIEQFLRRLVHHRFFRFPVGAGFTFSSFGRGLFRVR